MRERMEKRARGVSRRRLLGGLAVGVGAAVLAPLAAVCSRSRQGQVSERPATPAPGVSATAIKLGTTFSVTGPGASYRGLLETLQAYLQRSNEGGGVNGRMIRLIVEDDQDTPGYTVAAAKRLVEQERVLAVVCPLGTATNMAAADYYTRQQLPQLFVISGASAWGDTARYPWSMGFQPDYADIGRAFGRYIGTEWPGKRVGVLYENDDFGKDYLHYRDTLPASNAVVDEQAYAPASLDVTPQVTKLRNSGVEVWIVAATPRCAGLALKAAADLHWSPGILLADVANDPSLFGLAGGAPHVEGAVSVWWYEDAGSGDQALGPVRELLASHAPEVELANPPILGYMLGTMVVETLRRAGKQPTRQSLMAAAESYKRYVVPQLAPGLTLSTSKTDHYPLQSVRMARATGGKFVPFGGPVSGGAT